MPRYLVPLLALAIVLSGTGGAIVLLANHDAAPAAPGASAIAADAAPASIIELPTVVVRPDPVIPTLATVTVRPDRAESTAQGTQATVRVDRALAVVRVSHVASAPGGGLDMPYYSFGKTLRRANEE